MCIILCDFLKWSGWTAISALGALIAAGVAAIYTYFTYQLLTTNRETADKTNRLNEFQIYKEVSAHLNNADTKYLSDICRNNTLIINYNINAAEKNVNTVSSDYLNRILLNALEDIAVFWKNGLIKTETLNTGFGYTILGIGNCQTVIDHIIKSRLAFPNLFSGFEELYNEIFAICPEEETKGYRKRLIN